MKFIIAVIRPEQLTDVKQSLFDKGFRHMTAATVMGTAPKSEQKQFRGVKKEVSLFNRVRLEIAVDDSKVEDVLNCISFGAKQSGGFGRVFVLDLRDAMTVWTDARGEEALL